LNKTAIAALVVIVLAIVVVGGYVLYSNSGTGTLQVKLADPPDSWGDATQVYLNYNAIEIHRADAGDDAGWTIFEVSKMAIQFRLEKLSCYTVF